MSDLVKIFLTSGLTIIGGVVVFVLGQLLNELLIKPFFKYRDILGKIDRDLTFYSHIYSNAGVHHRDHPIVNEAHEKLRKLSCDLRIVYKSVSWIEYFKIKGWIMSEEQKEKIAVNLIGLSNSLLDHSYIENNLRREREIRKTMGSEN